jgi:hypothetical protein
VVLDAAATQEGGTGGPIVALNGAAVSGSDGLAISSGGSVVRGFAIHGFDRAIYLSGGGGSTIANNHLGTNLVGDTGIANQDGIWVDSSNNLIGGTGAADRNVISGNTIDGVVLRGRNNTGAGTYLGTDRTGTRDRDRHDGVWRTAVPAMVGGDTLGARNHRGERWAGVAASSLGLPPSRELDRPQRQRRGARQRRGGRAHLRRRRHHGRRHGARRR